MSTLKTINIVHPSSSSNNIILANNGNVGIGNSSPARVFEVTATSTNIPARLGNSQGNMDIGGSDGTVVSIDTRSWAMSLQTGGTERGRFDTSGNFLFNSGYGSVATAYGCRAWVNFNGTGTVAIRSSGNITSITDNGVGNYTVNFTNAMPDVNYSFVATCGVTALGVSKINQSSADPTSSALRLQATDASNAALDTTFTCVAIFR